VPKTLRDETNEWGLCRDEFADNQHWPYALYVREARRMLGEYVMVQKDCQSDVTKPDSVGMGSFVIDCHIVQRMVSAEGTVVDEGSFPDAPAKPYQIPYRSLTPKKSECDNLLVPVCLSASHIAYCSLRMEPVYMALGHASGVAAVMALKSHCPVQGIDVAALQAKLRGQKAVLGLSQKTPVIMDGIVMDDESAAYTGDWTVSTFGDPLYGSSHHDNNEGKGARQARFEIKVPEAGRYEVRLAYCAAPNRASQVPVTIEYSGGTQRVTVNQKESLMLGGHFVSLGTFPFTSDKPSTITVSNADTDGFVSVDAVQLLRAAATEK
jgi:hypothetical protein